MKRVTSNIDGLTLVEVMVSATVGMVVVLALAKMSFDAKKVQNDVSLSADFDHFGRLASLVLSNTPICSANFPANLASNTFDTAGISPATPVSININTLKYPDGTVLGAVGTMVSNALSVSAFSLRIFKELAAGTSYLANVRITVTKTAGLFMGKGTVSTEFPILLQTHILSGTTTRIDGCAGTSSLPSYYLHQAQGLNGSCGWSTSPYYCGASVNSDPTTLFDAGCWVNHSTYGTCTFGAGGTCPGWVTANGDTRLGVCP